MTVRRLFAAAAIAAALAGVPVAPPAVADISKTPKAEATIRSMGATWSGKVLRETFKVYMPLLLEAPKDGVTVTRDHEYGPDPRHRLDVYAPSTRPAAPVPVFVMVHGGGFTRGDKTNKNHTYLDNVGNYFARAGLVGVNMTYRFAPQHKWPSGAQDIAAALKWLRANIARHGGDPDRIVLGGTSAGAAHVATYIFHEELQAEAPDGVVGAVLMSGQYKPVPGLPPMTAYYGADTARYSAMSAIGHVDGRKIPVFIVFAEFDPYWMQMESIDLYRALCERDKQCPRLLRMVGHNHLSVTTSINTPDETLGPRIIDFIRRGR